MATKIPKDTRCFTFVNANPEGKRTGDCIMRAVAEACDHITWDDAIDLLCAISHEMHIAPQDPAAERELLKRLGFARQKQPKWSNGKKLTGKDFCTWLDTQVQAGTITPNAAIVANIGAHHVVCVRHDTSGHFRIHDTWDCSGRCVGMWWIKEAPTGQ